MSFADSCMENNRIRHRTSLPYHPATNGLAEWAVQIIKNGLRKIAEGLGDMELRLARFYFTTGILLIQALALAQQNFC